MLHEYSASKVGSLLGWETGVPDSSSGREALKSTQIDRRHYKSTGGITNRQAALPVFSLSYFFVFVCFFTCGLMSWLRQPAPSLAAFLAYCRRPVGSTDQSMACSDFLLAAVVNRQLMRAVLDRWASLVHALKRSGV